MAAISTAKNTSASAYTVEITGLTVGKKYHLFIQDLKTDGSDNGWYCRYSQTADDTSFTYKGSTSATYSQYNRAVRLYCTDTTKTSHSVGTRYSGSQLPGDSDNVTGAWSAIIYAWSGGGTTYVTVKYYKNGGTWSSGSDPYTDTVESGSYSGTSTPSGMVSKTNYRLLGWSSSSTATTATYGTNDAIGPVGTNLTLYAVWEELPYITLDAGEGRFGTDRYAYFHIDYGGYVYFNRYAPTRDGYTLIGWSATQGAASPTYGPNDAVGPLHGSSYKYYAVWQKATAKITLNGNGGLWDASTGIITVTLDVGDTLVFSKYSSLTRAGYIHLGWSTSQAATTAAWGVNGSVTVGATDATYYAVWKKKSIDLFYWSNATWDAANIKAGQPISNLTATRWNNLLAKIKELADAEGDSYSYSTVNPSTTFYASQFNSARLDISNRTGYGTLPAEQFKDYPVKAALFEGEGSLKSALNAAITHYNNS